MNTKRKRGFTLTEMLVVISIIGIGAAMTMALGAGFVSGNTLSQATRLTQAYLMEARGRAIASRLNTSVIIYRDDNLAVMTDHNWMPVGQALVIPEPCYYYIYSGDDYMAPGWDINKIAPKYFIMTITFEAGGKAIKNFPAAYWNRQTRCGAIFIQIRNPLQREGTGGSIQSDEGDSLMASGWTGWFAAKGYCVIGGELVGYQTLTSVGAGILQINSVQRNLFGSGNEDKLKGKPILPAGLCGTLMVICATGHCVTVQL
jgi:prepilin-type N-terminal cleavage/methylation domain-containing protein